MHSTIAQGIVADHRGSVWRSQYEDAGKAAPDILPRLSMEVGIQ